jgi:hypothetical protein
MSIEVLQIVISGEETNDIAPFQSKSLQAQNIDGLTPDR